MKTAIATPQPLPIKELEAIIATRANADPEGSYTAKLLAQGLEKSCKKLGEEAVELALAAQNGYVNGIVGEAADVIYHLLVVLRARNVTLEEVEIELRRRHEQMSGNPKSDRRGT